MSGILCGNIFRPVRKPVLSYLGSPGLVLSGNVLHGTVWLVAGTAGMASGRGANRRKYRTGVLSSGGRHDFQPVSCERRGQSGLYYCAGGADERGWSQQGVAVPVRYCV